MWRSKRNSGTATQAAAIPWQRLSSPRTCIGGLGSAWQESIGALLEGLCTMDAAAREALFQAPEGEMLAILDVLEPLKLKEGKPTCAPG